MITPLDFVAELLLSTVRLFLIFLTDVLPRDPMAAILGLAGGILIGVSVLFFGYLVAGAAVDAVGRVMPSPGRTPQRRE